MNIDAVSTLFSIKSLFTLAMLIMLQAVLGFDNLLYLSLESKRVEESKQSFVRRLGVGLAIFLRIALLFVVLVAIERLQDPFFEYGLQAVEGAEHAVDAQPHQAFVPTEAGKWFAARFNVHAVIVLAGGIFIIYTAFKEIVHMLAINQLERHDNRKTRGVGAALFWIVLMNLVFSFDSILSAIALTHNFWLMAVAIIVGGLLMIFLADHVAEFLKRNRMYEVLGLFILFIVGVMLVSEGGHLASMHLFGYKIEPMAKATFYFVIGILVVVDMVQSRYQSKLMAEMNTARGGQAV